MDANVNKTAGKESQASSHRGKYVTLVFLLIWVAAVFAFTFFKFSGSGR